MMKNTGDALFLSAITFCAGIVIWAFISILGEETSSQEISQISTSKEVNTPHTTVDEAAKTQPNENTDQTGLSKDEIIQAKNAIRLSEEVTKKYGLIPLQKLRTAEQLKEFCEISPDMTHTEFEMSAWPDGIWQILNEADYCNTHGGMLAENIWVLATKYFSDERPDIFSDYSDLREKLERFN